jgi:hypothetical protein
MKPRLPLSRLLACGVLLAAGLPAEEFTLRTGFDYSSGDYGLPLSTQITTVPLSVSYALNQTTWDLGLSYLRINGPGDVVPGVGRFIRRRLLSKQTNKGVGDLTLGVTRYFPGPEDRPWSWSAGAEVKFGTASAEKSLGTGRDDFTTHVDFTWSAGALTPFVTLGHRWLGNPVGSDLRNYFYGTVGVNWACTETTTVAVMADWSQKNADSGEASSNYTLSVTRAFGEKWQLQGYGTLGQSDATADHGYGLSLGRRF